VRFICRILLGSVLVSWCSSWLFVCSVWVIVIFLVILIILDSMYLYLGWFSRFWFVILNYS